MLQRLDRLENTIEVVSLNNKMGKNYFHSQRMAYLQA